MLDAGTKSLDDTFSNLIEYLSKSYNIRFEETDIKNIFKTYQIYSSYRYKYKLEKIINSSNNLDTSVIKKEIENISNDSSFIDYQTRVLEDIMEYLKKLNRFNDIFNKNYFNVKNKVSIFVKDNYNKFINNCHNNLITII